MNYITSKLTTELSGKLTSKLTSCLQMLCPNLIKICPILKLGKPNLKFQVWAPIFKLGRFQFWAAGPSCPNLNFFSILRNINVLNLNLSSIIEIMIHTDWVIIHTISLT